MPFDTAINKVALEKQFVLKKDKIVSLWQHDCFLSGTYPLTACGYGENANDSAPLASKGTGWYIKLAGPITVSIFPAWFWFRVGHDPDRAN